MAVKPRKSFNEISSISIRIWIIFWLISGCTSSIPIAQTPTASPSTGVPITTQPSRSPSATATTLPTKTETPTMAVTPKFWTPGPTPTAIQVSVPPGECVVSPPLQGNAMDVQRIGSTSCFVWADEFNNETGFRLMLQFGYNGEVFLYDLPADTTGMPFPAVLLEPLGQSFEYCMEHKNYDVTLYALLPDQEPQPFTGFGFGGECDRLEMPSATPQPASTRTAAPLSKDFPPTLYIKGPVNGYASLVLQEGAEIQEIASLGEVKQVNDALRVGQTVLVLTDIALLAVDMQNGQVKTVEGLPPEYFIGAMTTSPNQEKVILIVSFGTQPSDGGLLLEYSSDTRSLKPLSPVNDIFPYTSFLRPVGLTDDNLLYMIPLGGDASFIEILRYDLDNRQTSVLDVGSSESDAAVSPDGRFLVTHSVDLTNPSTDPLIRGIRLIPLQTGSQPNRWIKLPFYPSRPVGPLVWSPDSRFVYFSIDPTHAEAGDFSYGIWKLDVQTMEVSLVAENERVWSHPITLSEDEQWLLLWPEFVQDYIAVNLKTGLIVSIPKPEGGSLLVRNQQ